MNKLSRVTKTNTTLIDHILSNDFVNIDSFMGTVKSDISDHFPIIFVMSEQFFNNIQNQTTIRKREINEKSKQYFMEILNKVNWKHIYSLANTNLAYKYFLHTFNGLHNNVFPIKKVNLKLKTVFNPWMPKRLQKSSKRKQKLYNKFLKSKTNKNEKKYKTYKYLFEILKEKSKKLYYLRKLGSCKQYEENIGHDKRSYW